AVDEAIVGALEGETFLDRGAPQAGEDRQLLLEAIEALALRRERDAVGSVLGLEPSCPDADVHAPAAHRIDLRHRDGKRSREPERRRGDHRAKAYPARFAGQRP